MVEAETRSEIALSLFVACCTLLSSFKHQFDYIKLTKVNVNLNIAVFEINIKLNCTYACSNSTICVVLKNLNFPK